MFVSFTRKGWFYLASFVAGFLLLLMGIGSVPKVAASDTSTSQYTLTIVGTLSEQCQVSYRYDESHPYLAGLELRAAPARDTNQCVVTIEADLGIPVEFVSYSVEGDGDIQLLEINRDTADDALIETELQLLMPTGETFTELKINN